MSTVHIVSFYSLSWLPVSYMHKFLLNLHNVEENLGKF